MTARFAIPTSVIRALALSDCRTQVGGQDGSGTHCVGSVAGHRPWPKFLGDLNSDIDNPIGGGGCCGHLPPQLVMHALCMQATKASERLQRGRRATPAKNRPRTKKTKIHKKPKKGSGANPGHKTSQISQGLQSMMQEWGADPQKF